MLKTWRFAGVLLGVALVSTGCDKSGTTPPPGKPQDETYAKKLIGVWEGTDKVFGPVNVEFKADNGVAMTLGAKDKDPLQMTGTFKVVKEEGKTVTIETEVAPNIPGAKEKLEAKKKTSTVTFDDADNITLTIPGEEEPKKLKRKS